MIRDELLYYRTDDGCKIRKLTDSDSGDTLFILVRYNETLATHKQLSEAFESLRKFLTITPKRHCRANKHHG